MLSEDKLALTKLLANPIIFCTMTRSEKMRPDSAGNSQGKLRRYFKRAKETLRKPTTVLSTFAIATAGAFGGGVAALSTFGKDTVVTPRYGAQFGVQPVLELDMSGGSEISTGQIEFPTHLGPFKLVITPENADFKKVINPRKENTIEGINVLRNVEHDLNDGPKAIEDEVIPKFILLFFGGSLAGGLSAMCVLEVFSRKDRNTINKLRILGYTAASALTASVGVAGLTALSFDRTGFDHPHFSGGAAYLKQQIETMGKSTSSNNTAAKRSNDFTNTAFTPLYNHLPGYVQDSLRSFSSTFFAVPPMVDEEGNYRTLTHDEYTQLRHAYRGTEIPYTSQNTPHVLFDGAFNLDQPETVIFSLSSKDKKPKQKKHIPAEPSLHVVLAEIDGDRGQMILVPVIKTDELQEVGFSVAGLGRGKHTLVMQEYTGEINKNGRQTPLNGNELQIKISAPNDSLMGEVYAHAPRIYRRPDLLAQPDKSVPLEVFATVKRRKGESGSVNTGSGSYFVTYSTLSSTEYGGTAPEKLWRTKGRTYDIDPSLKMILKKGRTPRGSVYNGLFHVYRVFGGRLVGGQPLLQNYSADNLYDDVVTTHESTSLLPVVVSPDNTDQSMARTQNGLFQPISAHELYANGAISRKQLQAYLRP